MTLLVKACGFVRPGPACLAALRPEDRPDAVGLVLWPGSKRAVADPEPLVAEAHALGLLTVGVFVDASERALRATEVDVLQLHGHERASLIRRLPGRVWKALRVGPDFDEDDARRAWDAGAEAVLLDAWHPHEPGGTGAVADWEVAARLAEEGPVILAGGLGPGNVADAVAAVRPHGVDASSALELRPGLKDPTLIARFCRAARTPLESSSP